VSRKDCVCPIHHLPLTWSVTRYGLRGDCPLPRCTVVWWADAHTTPADAETRALRQQAHALIDPLWKGQHVKRGRLYRTFKKQFHTGHIGESDATTCRRIIAWALRFRREHGLPVPPTQEEAVAK